MASKKVSFSPDEGLDQFISDLARISRESSKGVYIANFERQKEFFTVLKSLHSTVESDEKWITYELESNPFDGSGYISIAAKRMTTTNPKMLAQLLESASNVDFCPKTDGTVEVTLMFYRLYDKISNVE